MSINLYNVYSVGTRTEAQLFPAVNGVHGL